MSVAGFRMRSIGRGTGEEVGRCRIGQRWERWTKNCFVVSQPHRRRKHGRIVLGPGFGRVLIRTLVAVGRNKRAAGRTVATPPAAFTYSATSLPSSQADRGTGGAPNQGLAQKSQSTRRVPRQPAGSAQPLLLPQRETPGMILRASRCGIRREWCVWAARGVWGVATWCQDRLPN